MRKEERFSFTSFCTSQSIQIGSWPIYELVKTSSKSWPKNLWVLRIIVLLFVLLLLASCSTNTKNEMFDKLLTNNLCDEAALNIPGFQNYKTKASAENLGSKSASYVLTGTAYGVDLIYFITAGVILPTVVCSPALIIDAPLGAGGDAKATGACFDKVYSATQRTDSVGSRVSLGNKVFEGTSGWRCPDLTFAVNDVNKIVNCHERAGNYEKAIKQLKILVSPDSFGGCIDPKEEEKALHKLVELRKFKQVNN